MIQIKYLDSEEMIPVTFSRPAINLIKLDGTTVTSEAGFNTYRMPEYGSALLGEFPDFTTVYVQDENSVTYSNDGSIYVEPVIEESETTDPVTPSEPTVETVTELDRLSAQVLYTALMTDTLLEDETEEDEIEDSEEEDEIEDSEDEESETEDDEEEDDAETDGTEVDPETVEEDESDVQED